MALFMPHTVTVVFVGFVMYCWLDPSGMYLYYNFLPASYKTRLFLLICLCQDFHCLMYSIAVMVPLLQLQVIAFDNICCRLSMVLKSLATTSFSSGKEKAERDFQSLRELQIYVLLMNGVHCDLIFVNKLFSISFCVGMGYAGVAYFHENLALAIMCGLLCIDVGVIHSLVYARGFKVRLTFGKVVKTMLDSLRRRNRGVMERQVRSVLPMGIKVGNFHTLERISTPRFLDFVLNNIVSMLVMYH